MQNMLATGFPSTYILDFNPPHACKSVTSELLFKFFNHNISTTHFLHFSFCHPMGKQANHLGAFTILILSYILPKAKQSLRLLKYTKY